MKFHIIDNETGEVLFTVLGIQRTAYLLMGRNAQNTRVFREDERGGRRELNLNYTIWQLESSLREVAANENQ